VMMDSNSGRRRSRGLALVGAALGLLYMTPAAHAADAPDEKGVTASLNYRFDAMGAFSGGAVQAVRSLDNLGLSLDLDLDRTWGWAGASAHAELSNTSGRAPSELAAAAQGVDNIEVSANRLRLYQAWIETDFAHDKANLRAGFSDLSGEFATVEASGLLLNPSFGMAPEFAASGAAAYPSTALGLRLRMAPTTATYVQVAAANARTGVPGDRGGADFSFDQGAMLLAEAGWTGAGKVAIGYWRLSERQDDLAELDPFGAPVSRAAQGAYVLAEQILARSADGARSVTGFVRAGVADGRTTAFSGSLQAGLLVSPAFASRPESSLSFGVTQARLAPAWRAASATAGAPLGRDETVFELTYSDQLTRRVRVQPDLQYIRRPSGDPTIKDAFVAGLRLEVGF
jgi:porin